MLMDYSTKKISIHALREEGDSQHTLGKAADINFYPRPPRGGRPAAKESAGAILSISIHALREEGDDTRYGSGSEPTTISIHALREEGDRGHQTSCYPCKNFYPRPPRGGRRCVLPVP